LVGVDGEVKLADFGLAGSIHELRMLPTMSYHVTWPPEDLATGRAFVSERGDIYALGVTAYRLFNGDSVLFQGIDAGADLSQLISSGQFPNRKAWLPHTHASLRRAVNRALEPKPEKRFSNADQFRRALEAANPIVSWAPDVIAGVMTWDGQHRGTTWRATLMEDAGAYRFELSSSRSGRATIRHRKDELLGSLSEAHSQAAAVLGRISLQGK